MDVFALYIKTFFKPFDRDCHFWCFNAQGGSKKDVDLVVPIGDCLELDRAEFCQFEHAFVDDRSVMFLFGSVWGFTR